MQIFLAILFLNKANNFLVFKKHVNYNFLHVFKLMFSMKSKKKHFFSLCIFIFMPFIINAQDYFTLSGKINNQNGIAISEINLKIIELDNIGVSTDNSGKYKIKLPANKEFTIVFTHLQYEEMIIKITGDRKSVV